MYGGVATYEERLRCLNLMRLETRRVRSDLIETSKIINGKIAYIRIIYYSINLESVFEFDEGGRRRH